MRSAVYIVLFGTVTFMAGCSRGDMPVSATPAEETGLFGRVNRNAYDVIKLCRFSDEEGPVYFDHGLHADLRDTAGKAITCLRCHHDLEEAEALVPRGCSKCHPQHDHKKEDRPST